MRLDFSAEAFRDLEQLDRLAQRRIIKKLEFYASQEDPLRFAERLTVPRDGEWRFRIGEYRAIFHIVNGGIMVLRIGNRKDIYK